MADKKQRVHALGLVSGGLDSTLAAALILKQGIEVTGLNFHTGFCVLDHHRQMGEQKTRDLENPALKAESKLYFPVELIDISEEYLSLVTNPRYGYGKNANPCIDCRIMMLVKAREMMEELEADFIFTGEVIGQRPMTQMPRTLELIERRAGLQGKLLRPLSAQLLTPTIAEETGLVDRALLKNFNGRTRKPQMELASELGIEDYPSPAGGCCFLTDPGYTRKFFDLLDHREVRNVTVEDFTMLKVGRHLRVKDDLKLIAGRHEKENDYLERFQSDYISFEVDGPPGPIVLMEGNETEENIRLAAAVTARYSDAPADEIARVFIRRAGKEDTIEVIPLTNDDTKKWVIR